MKRIISSLLAIFMILSSIGIVSAANDWSRASDWAVNDLTEAQSLGLFPKCLKGRDLTFKITRAEQAALAVKIYEVATGNTATPAENPFTDTTDEEVLKALKLGITSGTSATTFEPDANLTREQAATMLARVYKKINISGWTLEKDSEFKFEFDMPQKFVDHAKISSWAEQSVYFMASKQWILGNEKKEFMPLDNCSREQALIIAKRMTTFFKNAEAGTSKEEFKVVFIGGSLTQLGSRWIQSTKQYLQQKMPDKKVVTLNAGIGGTPSKYGAGRFQNNVIAQNPDLVVIEFTSNDCSAKPEKMAPYFESMLRQCASAKNAPGVIVLHAPRPIDSNHSGYSTYMQSIKTKNEIAAHYNIQTVNVYEYIQDVYYDSDTDGTFMDWLGNYYKKTSTGDYDVHPKDNGYELYAQALAQAFDKKGLDTFLKPIAQASVYSKGDDAKLATARYEQSYMSNKKFELSSEWTVVTDANADKDSTYPVTASALQYPKSEAVASTTAKGATITFKTTANAIYLPTLSHTEGNSVTVSANGTKVGEETSVHGSYNNEYPISDRIDLGGSGEKTVTITTVEDGRPFRLLYVIEEYNN